MDEHTDTPNPTEPAPQTATPSATPPVDAPVPVYDRRERSSIGRSLAIGLAVAALAIGGVTGFVIGNSSTSKGPATLAAAFKQYSQGKLSAGDVRGTLTQLGPQALRGLFGGGGGGFGGNGPRGGAGGGGGRGIVGSITAVNGNVITVSTAAGDVKVQVGPATQITKSAPGAAADLVVGGRVRVGADLSGSASGGTVTAQTVQELPPGAGGAGPGGGGLGGGTAPGAAGSQ